MLPGFGGTKAIDILALAPGRCAWVIEVKDYRRHRRTKTIDLAGEIAAKVRDSLAAFLAAHLNANDATEKSLAGQVLASTKVRVVLHLEQPAKHSRLFPRAIDPAHVKQKRKPLVKAIDAHPLILEMGRMGDIAWAVQ